ncbi:MAG: phytoene/squalene synthase family protein [Anaerolineales bacterium]
MALDDISLQDEYFPQNSLTAGITSTADYAYCRQVMLRASKNYSFASNFLPHEKRIHVDALYAFLRIGDDRVDVSYAGYKTPEEAIDAWEQAYWQAFETGDSPEPVMRAYLNTAIVNDIPANTMSAYFRAMKEDLVKKRYGNFSELLHYMDGSAVPVGRAMTYILGVRKPYTFSKALPRADALSVAMQLSNFWRDIGQDWNIGRVYIPQEDMDAFHIHEEDLAAGRVTANFIDLLEFEINRTRGYYKLAREGIPMLATGQWGVMSGLLLYERILNSIRANNYDVFTRRARTNVAQKVLLMANAWLNVRKIADQS